MFLYVMLVMAGVWCFECLCVFGLKIKCFKTQDNPVTPQFTMNAAVLQTRPFSLLCMVQETQPHATEVGICTMIQLSDSSQRIACAYIYKCVCVFVSDVNLREVQVMENVPFVLLFSESPLMLRVLHVTKVILRHQGGKNLSYSLGFFGLSNN